MVKRFLTTSEAAKVLGISRVAVFKRIRKGSLRALKVGHRYLIEPKEVGLLYRELTERDKKRIHLTVKKVLREYGDVIQKLGHE